MLDGTSVPNVEMFFKFYSLSSEDSNINIITFITKELHPTGCWIPKPLRDLKKHLIMVFATWRQRFCVFLFSCDLESSQQSWDSSQSYPMCQMLKTMYKFMLNTFDHSISISYWSCAIVLKWNVAQSWWTSLLPTRILLLFVMLSLKLVCIDRNFF